MATEHQIEVANLEAIADGGVRRVIWHIAQDRRWLAAVSYPGARVSFADGAPGVVWRRRVLLSLRTGTRLMRVESRPQRNVQQDPLAYLWRSAKAGSERVVRSYFRVSQAGRLERAASEAR
jgi:hypothetical protein